jgi:hypothetical protein
MRSLPLQASVLRRLTNAIFWPSGDQAGRMLRLSKLSGSWCRPPPPRLATKMSPPVGPPLSKAIIPCEDQLGKRLRPSKCSGRWGPPCAGIRNTCGPASGSML